MRDDVDLLLDVLERLPDATTLSVAVRDEQGRAVDTRLVWMNAVARASQPDPEAAIGRLGSELWPEMLRNGTFDACMRVLDTGIPQRGEFVWTESSTFRPGGYDYRAVRIGSELLLWVLRDATDVVARLLESESRFRTAFDRAPVGIAVIDPRGRVLAANDALARMAQRPPADMVGVQITSLFHPADAKAARSHLLSYRSDTRARLRLLDARGRTLHVAASVATLPAPLGEPGHIIVHLIDITAESHRDEAHRLDALGQLAGGIAHDVNNLLHVIGMTADLAVANGTTDDDLDRIKRSVEKASHLTRQLLSVSRRQPVVPVHLDMRDAVREMTSLLKRVAGAGIEVTVSVSDQPLPVYLGRGQLEQLLLNLSVNACEAMPDGGVLAITATSAVLDALDLGEWPGLRPGAYAALTVSDTGTGMSDETIARAFEPFFTTKAERGGTGLGLATVRGIVADGQGAISIASTPGHGTAVRTLLPLDRHRTTTVPKAPLERMPAVTGTVVVVDDDPEIADLVARVLGGAGLAVVACTTEHDALAAFASHDVALLVTDVLMRPTGTELAERLREQQPDTPVVLMSGYVDSVANVTTSLETGRTVFLPKPFTRAELLTSVADALRPASRNGGRGAAGRRGPRTAGSRARRADRQGGPRQE